MTSPTFDYTALRSSLFKLAEEFVEKIAATWRADWTTQPPRVGYHFTYWDIKALPSYAEAIAETARVPGIEAKYDKVALERPLGAFLELTVAILPDPSFLEKVFDFWWSPFVSFLEAQTVPIRLFIGLSNFKAPKPEYRLDAETVVHFYGDRSLASELANSLHAPMPDPFPSSGVSLHSIPGAIQVDFVRPADQDTLQYDHYSHECIHRMLLLQNALHLSAFGRLVTGPWIPICNPAFPVDGVRAIGSPDQGSRIYEPVATLDDPAWDRFVRNHNHLRTLQDEDDADVEKVDPSEGDLSQPYSDS